MNQLSIDDPFLGFQENYTAQIFEDIDFQRSPLPLTPTRPSIEKSREKTNNGKEKIGPGKLKIKENEELYDIDDFSIFDEFLYKSMPDLTDSRITAQDEMKIAKAMNPKVSVNCVSKYQVDQQQIQASWDKEGASASYKDIPCIDLVNEKVQPKSPKNRSLKKSIDQCQNSLHSFLTYLKTMISNSQT